jgi:hypothetical protein
MDDEFVLHVRVNGVDQFQTFKSASDAIDHGLEGLLSNRWSPIKVTKNNRTIASEGDFFILWEESKQAD